MKRRLFPGIPRRKSDDEHEHQHDRTAGREFERQVELRRLAARVPRKRRNDKNEDDKDKDQRSTRPKCPRALMFPV
jgi:hypothetical protein